MFVLMYSASSCKSMADTSSAVGSTPAESKAFNWHDGAGKQQDLGWCRDSAGTASANGSHVLLVGDPPLFVPLLGVAMALH